MLVLLTESTETRDYGQRPLRVVIRLYVGAPLNLHNASVDESLFWCGGAEVGVVVNSVQPCCQLPYVIYQALWIPNQPGAAKESRKLCWQEGASRELKVYGLKIEFSNHVNHKIRQFSWKMISIWTIHKWNIFMAWRTAGLTLRWLF